MLVGIELPPDTLASADEDALRVIRPALVKTRFTGADYLRRISSVLPGAWILSRPEVEAYDAMAMRDAYRVAKLGFTSAGLLDRWLGHEISNEPNHQNGPYSYGGHYLYSAQVDEMIARFVDASGRFVLPGLQPYWNTAEWSLMLDERRRSVRWSGAHCYWQRGHLVSGISDAVQQAGNAPPSTVIVTEFGQAPPDAIGRADLATQLAYARDTEQERADACRQAIQLGQARGWTAMILFTLRAPNFGAFEFSPSTVRDILHSITNTLPGQPTPAEEDPAMPIDNRTEAQMFFVWAVARIQADRDPYDLGAFQTHLQAIGADSGSPYRYGYPRVSLAVPKAPRTGV